MACIEAAEPFSHKSIIPKAHGVHAALKLPSDPSLRCSLGQAKNDISPAHVFSRKSATTNFSFKFRANGRSQFKFARHPKTLPEQCVRCQCYSALGLVVVAPLDVNDWERIVEIASKYAD